MSRTNETAKRGDSWLPRKLVFSRLRAGMPGLTAECGGALAQAAAVCLQHHGHLPGVLMHVEGDYQQEFEVHWELATEQARRSWGDLQEATEEGACGMALLLIEELAGYTVYQRSWKGTGFDYWLAPEDSPAKLFQDLGRLEVSGILAGSEVDIKKRHRAKLDQIEKLEIPLVGFVVIVEFGGPQCRVVKI